MFCDPQNNLGFSSNSKSLGNQKADDFFNLAPITGDGRKELKRRGKQSQKHYMVSGSLCLSSFNKVELQLVK